MQFPREVILDRFHPEIRVTGDRAVDCETVYLRLYVSPYYSYAAEAYVSLCDGSYGCSVVLPKYSYSADMLEVGDPDPYGIPVDKYTRSSYIRVYLYHEAIAALEGAYAEMAAWRRRCIEA